MASQKKNTNLADIARLAEKAKTDGDSTNFLSGSFDDSDFKIALGDCIEFNVEVPEFEQTKIINQVAYNASIPRPITPESLIQEFKKHENAYLAIPKKSFRLLTEISLSWTIKAPKIIIGGATLTFQPNNKVGFSARSSLFSEMRNTLWFELPTNYLRLSAHVRARTPFEASERALKAIDLARACWNLAINRGKSRRSSSGRPPPVNDIRLSPFHTVHDIKGNLATESYWYDSAYMHPAKTFSNKNEFKKILIFSKKLRSRLAIHPYRSDIEDALIRYVRALDSSDLNDTLLRLWSLLEYLTDSTNDPNKVTTRRAAFMFADGERAQMVLSYLANYRNSFVHTGSDTNNIESLVFQLKRYVDNLLIFHIGNRFGFESRNEAALFMDFPPNKNELKLRIKRLNAVIKFIGD